jgi:hypothetical protein
MTDTPADMIRRYHELHPVEFSQLGSLTIEQGPAELCLSLDLQSHGDGRLTLRFDGVRDLKIDWPQWSRIRVDVVEITDMSSRGLEDLVYRVHEGAGLFAFSCREFEAIRN